MSEAEASCFIIGADFIAPPDGVKVKNYCFDGEPQFKHKARKKPLKHFVLHETAGRSAEGCKKTLLRKGYGVHLILAQDGLLTQHLDLATDVAVHANQLNKTSIGIEIVNPYAPKLARGMKYTTIPAQWWTWCPDKKDRRYVLPTPAQLKTLEIAVPFLCEQLGIPYVFPTQHLNAKKRHTERVGILRKRIPGPGVVAHRDFATHADGRYPLEYLIRHTV